VQNGHLLSLMGSHGILRGLRESKWKMAISRYHLVPSLNNGNRVRDRASLAGDRRPTAYGVYLAVVQPVWTGEQAGVAVPTWWPVNGIVRSQCQHPWGMAAISSERDHKRP